MYRIAGNFCGDFNLANWRIFHQIAKMNSAKHVTSAHNHIAQRGRVRWTRIHQIKISPITFLGQFANFNAHQNNRLYGI